LSVPGVIGCGGGRHDNRVVSREKSTTKFDLLRTAAKNAGRNQPPTKPEVTMTSREKVDRALETYAEKCSAYQSVKGCIDCSWGAVIEEE
jgi:hypothetical protein